MAIDDNNSIAVDERSNEDLDALADNDTATNAPERPMSAEPDKTSVPDKKSAPSSKDEYEFVHNGKPIKGTREQILKWAQMGYDRPQVMSKLNQEKLKWDQERAQYAQEKQKYTPYQQIDQWAAKNPQEWQRLEQMWKQTQANPGYLNEQGQYQQGQQQYQQGQYQNGQTQPGMGDQFQPYISKIQSLEQQLSQIVPTVNQFVEFQQSAKEKSEDQKLDQEIQSIRSAHQDLDWNTIDQDGKSLEMKVLEHAHQTGIPTFRAALRDLLHDDLMSKAQAQAKQSVAKSIQTRSKLGVLGESSTPTKGRESNPSRDIRNTSYEDLEREIREEMRRG